MYYCRICATQAASQGFTVTQISHQQPQAPQMPQPAMKRIPNYPDLNNNPKAHQLKQLMQDIIELETEFKEASPSVRDHYQDQEVLLNSFYDQVVESVERMRSDHLADLRKEEKNSS